MKRGKKYKEELKKIDKNKLLSPVEAIKFIKENSFAKFDEAVDISINLGVDPRKAEQIVRGTIVLPHGTGKESRILVFAQGKKVEEAKKAGADFVGGKEYAEKISKGWLDFDVCIAAPDMMKHVGRLGKILGPRKLMPNPKSGTVTNDIEKAVKDTKKGKLEYRTDSQGVVHSILGKVSFEEKMLMENYTALKNAITKSKPPASKGKYIISIYISTTMGPSIKINPVHKVDTKEVA